MLQPFFTFQGSYPFHPAANIYIQVLKVLTRQLIELRESKVPEEWGLTQGPRDDNLAKGSHAHLILRQDAEMVVRIGRQIGHMHLGARVGGHRHGVPALLPVIIAGWNLLHPGEREAERRHENKSQAGNTESGFMEHDRKVGFINHSCTPSVAEFDAETALIYDCNRTESSYLQLERFPCFKWSWGSLPTL